MSAPEQVERRFYDTEANDLWASIYTSFECVKDRYRRGFDEPGSGSELSGRLS
ncbi:hypothetical protein BGX26_000810, partial [Mortierella sp. AD094]